MRTIIQDFPTIYGEALNGSVYGQPNGSIARPPQNAAGTITLSGDTVTVTYTGKFPTLSPEFAFYTVEGLTGSVNVASYSYLMVCVFNSTDTVIATHQINYGDEITLNSAGFFGPYADKPTNGDTLTVKVIAYDQDNNVIVSSEAVSASAVVS